VAVRHLDWEGCFNVRDLGGPPAPAPAITAFLRAEGTTADGALLALLRDRVLEPVAG
jgi:hypothetical protein